jgi:hypothetical protein
MPVQESVAATPWYAIFWGVPANRAIESIPRPEETVAAARRGTYDQLRYFRGFAQELINHGRSKSPDHNPYWISTD